jgi:DNA-binding NarL/FixJ family response regulator
MMFKRVLIAEDHESISRSVQLALEGLGITDSKHVSYCDHAFSWIQKGLSTDQPYDLFITDLSFEEDGTAQKIIDGITLIKAVKNIQPNLKILVFTAEGRAEIITSLIQNLGIDAYVRKARRDVDELRSAIQAIAKGKTYYPSQVLQTKPKGNSFNFTSYDTTIIGLLATGTKQKEIPQYLRENNIKPAGLSSIEKRLNLIKYVLDFTTNEQLIAYCKDFNII